MQNKELITKTSQLHERYFLTDAVQWLLMNFMLYWTNYVYFICDLLSCVYLFNEEINDNNNKEM